MRTSVWNFSCIISFNPPPPKGGCFFRQENSGSRAQTDHMMTFHHLPACKGQCLNSNRVFGTPKHLFNSLTLLLDRGTIKRLRVHAGQISRSEFLNSAVPETWFVPVSPNYWARSSQFWWNDSEFAFDTYSKRSWSHSTLHKLRNVRRSKSLRFQPPRETTWIK